MNARNVNASKGTQFMNSAYRGMQRATDFAASSISVFITLSFLALIAVVVFIIYKVRKFSLQTKNLTTELVIPANPMAGEFVVTPFAALPTLVQGNEFSASFWLFVDNIADKYNNGDHRIVMYQGNNSHFENGFFFVIMDGNTNRLYVCVHTNGVEPAKEGGTGKSTLGDVLANRYYLKAVVDYVPLQRWVHFCFGVKDTTLSLYMDGELYTVATIYDLPTQTNDVRPVITNPTGDIMVGGKSGVFGVNGYISRAEYMNFAVTLKQSKQKYDEGPYSYSFLRYLGLPAIGVRSPFYYAPATVGTPETKKTETVNP